MLPRSNGRVVDGAAAFVAASGEDGDGDEAATEKDVKDETEESEKGDAAEEAGKDDSKGGIYDSSSSHTLDCLLPCWNMIVMTV